MISKTKILILLAFLISCSPSDVSTNLKFEKDSQVSPEPADNIERIIPEYTPKLDENLAFCEDDTISATLCRNEVNFRQQTILDKLGSKNLAFWFEESNLHIVARAERKRLRLDGTITEGLYPLYRDGEKTLWGASYRFSKLKNAIIDIGLMSNELNVSTQTFVGPTAPPIFQNLPDIKGKLVKIPIDTSNIPSPRHVNVYTPKNYSTDKTYPVIYMADAQWSYPFIQVADLLIEQKEITPVIIVSLYNASDSVAKRPAAMRAAEYLKESKHPAYKAHQEFFMQDVIPFVEENYSVGTTKSDKILHGTSLGGSWAVSTGLENQDTFFATIASSISKKAGTYLEGPQNYQLYLQAGTFEPNYQASTTQICNASLKVGVDCKLSIYNAGHSETIWVYHFAESLRQIIPFSR